MIKKLLAISLLGFYSFSSAQTTTAGTELTTPNQITSGTTHTWSGIGTVGTVPSGCATAGPCPGGPTPLYDPATNTIHFSYGAATVAQTFAVNQALRNVGAGVQVQGYNYSWQINNQNGDNRQSGTDTLTATVISYAADNATVRRTDTWTYNTKFDWTTFSGAVNYVNPGAVDQFGNLTVKFSGMDNGYWGGYFGPQVRNVNLSMRYTVDPCATNPAYSPNCANYSTVNISNNLVPNPTGYSASGTTINQSYAINQALGLSGANVLIHGFQWGYRANANGPYCDAWDIFGCWGSTITPSVTTSVNITDNNNNSLYSVNRTYTNSYNTTNYQYLFPSSRNLSTLGNFNFTASTYDQAFVGSMWSKALYTPDPCADPLSSPSCPGYQQAYMTQQCTANPLYNSACPGYAQALFTQQCNANQLSNPGCPGYAAAYLDFQCSANPLYSTACAGYETAYFNQQCSLDPLYNSRCTGYTTAYHDQQCSISALYASDCTGYDAAYLTQQCTANPLYSTQCSGYAVAYKNQQCSISALYATDCPGYSQAYLNQQCLRDSLYSTQCEGYKTAYAIKYLVGLNPAVTSAVNTSLTNTVETQRNDPANVTGTVDAYSTTTTGTSSTPATTSATSVSPVAVISTIKPAPAPATTMVAQAEPKKEEAGKRDGNSNTNNSAGDSSKPSDQPKSNREALAERRREAAQKEAVAKGKDLANEMGKAADMEAQKAVQNVVIQAMGFTPGFDTYNKAMIPDTVFYKPYTVYGNQRNVDNQNVSRRLMGGSDRLHQDMVDSQFELGK